MRACDIGSWDFRKWKVTGKFHRTAKLETHVHCNSEDMMFAIYYVTPCNHLFKWSYDS